MRTGFPQRIGPKQRDLFSDSTFDDQPWEKFRDGIEVRWIYSFPIGRRAALLGYSPRASLVRHLHVGFERVLILRGTQIDDSGEHRAGN